MYHPYVLSIKGCFEMLLVNAYMLKQDYKKPMNIHERPQFPNDVGETFFRDMRLLECLVQNTNF